MPVIHVNVPYPMLLRRLDFIVENRIHPEIYFSAEHLDPCRREELRRVAGVLDENGLERTLHGPFMDLSPGGVDRKVKEVTLDRLSKTVELAGILMPKMIVVHPGYEKWKFNGNVNLWLSNSIETWSALVQEASGKGLTIAIENVFEETPDTLTALLREIDSPHFRFCFDTGHHRAFAKSPLTAWFEALGNYFGEVHLHDNHGEMVDEHLPAGEGTFDFDGFFGLLARFGLNPVYTIEPHEEAHFRRSMEAIKKYI